MELELSPAWVPVWALMLALELLPEWVTESALILALEFRPEWTPDKHWLSVYPGNRFTFRW